MNEISGLFVAKDSLLTSTAVCGQYSMFLPGISIILYLISLISLIESYQLANYPRRLPNNKLSRTEMSEIEHENTDIRHEIHRNKRFLVINCENSTAWNPISFADMFQKSFGQEDDVWDELSIAKGEVLDPSIHGYYDGIVITGSRFNVRDSLPWYDTLCQFILDAANNGIPRIYGGCFGCQIIAKALGGNVDCNPSKRFVLKAEAIYPIEPYFSENLRCDDTDKKPFYRLIESHGDCVVTLPENAVRLASSETCQNEMYLAGKHKNILAAQSHPEFELGYAIRERIWPRVVDQLHRLNEEEVEIAKKSFDEFHPDDPQLINRLISRFLRNL
jgi:GMP synthase-like glutamine amidotransferase